VGAPPRGSRGPLEPGSGRRQIPPHRHHRSVRADAGTGVGVASPPGGSGCPAPAGSGWAGGAGSGGGGAGLPADPLRPCPRGPGPWLPPARLTERSTPGSRRTSNSQALTAWEKRPAPATCGPGARGRSGGGAKGGAAPPSAGIRPQGGPLGSAGHCCSCLVPSPAALTRNKSSRCRPGWVPPPSLTSCKPTDLDFTSAPVPHPSFKLWQ
jgi:hypothetical protein